MFCVPRTDSRRNSRRLMIMAKPFLDRLFVHALFGFVAMALVACVSSTSPNVDARATIEAGMKRYGELLKAQDSDAIAELFVPDGEMGTDGSAPQRGREVIRSFLKSFANVKVLSDELSITSINVEADTAIARETYHQVAQVGTDTPLDLHGRLAAEWRRQNDGRWLSQRVSAFPNK